MKLLVLAALVVLALAVPAGVGFDDGVAAYKGAISISILIK